MGEGCCCGHFRETKMAPLFAKQKAGCCESEMKGKKKPAKKPVKKVVAKAKKAKKK